MQFYQIRHYVDAGGHDYVAQWRKQIRDAHTCIAIDRRIMRMELGNFGDHKSLREGVWEMRLDIGPGYRLYYARAGDAVILLLCGGNKSKQSSDIIRACNYWRDWKRCNSAWGSADER